MEVQTLEVTVQEGGTVHLEGLPFEKGRTVEITLKEKVPELSQEEWINRLRKSYGTLAHTSFEEPEDYPPAEIKPLW